MKAKEPEVTHFHQKPRRKAEFIKPVNTLKTKAGYGGLGDDILSKAQAVLENNTVDFQPLAEMYLAAMLRAIEYASNPPKGEDNEALIAGMLYPAMQLKANGGMFRYPLITRISDKLLQFLEVIAEPDEDAIEIVLAFHTTLRALLMGRVAGTGGEYGDELMQALEEACLRYFEHYPANCSGNEKDYKTQF
jgi:hypothetical protein